MRPAVLVCLLLTACHGPDITSSPDAGPADAAAPTGQGSEARGELVINEVSPRGDGPDWLELHNRADEALDLCDYFVTDGLDRLDHYLPLAGVAPPEPCAPRMLEPGAYLVIVADDDVAAGPDHAPFKLGVADEAHVVDHTGRAVDSLLYLFADSAEGLTLARAPDGDGLFFFAEPTPGAANEGAAP